MEGPAAGPKSAVERHVQLCPTDDAIQYVADIERGDHYRKTAPPLTCPVVGQEAMASMGADALPSLATAVTSAVDAIIVRCHSSPNLVHLSAGLNDASSSTRSFDSASSAELIQNITELPTVDAFSTSAVLHYCKKKILIPYQRFLSLLGWRSPTAIDDTHCICANGLALMHVAAVVIITVVGYILQYASCFRRDTVGDYKLVTSEDDDSEVGDEVVCTGTLMGLYVIPDLLHFTSYCYTFYLLRCCESEQLQILMEKVFLQALHSRSHFLTQPKLVRTLRVFLGLSLGWIALSTIVQILHVAVESPCFTWMQPSDKRVENGFVVALVLTMTWNDIIHVTTIMSYCIQCQLLHSFIRSLCERVREKSISLQETIKEINESSKLLKHLNEEFAISVSLMMMYSGVMSFSGLTRTFTSGRLTLNGTLTLLTNFLSLSMWLLVFSFPLVQAARLSATCHCIKKLGLFLMTRPFGYQDVSQSQLDSFLLFTSSVDMQAKLFRVPVKPAFLFLVLTLFAFVFLLLSQMEIISIGL